MKGLFSHSGIITKVRAMRGKLLKNEQYHTMASLETVPEAVHFLSGFPAYHLTFSDLDDCSLHRGAIEQLLTSCLYEDYSKLYRFASLKQRVFLDFYFTYFEISLLKKCLRNAAAHHPASLELMQYEEFFQKHSSLNLYGLSVAASLEEFINSLKGSFYYEVLFQLNESGNTDPFVYEMSLDLLYFKRAWNYLNKRLPKSEQKALIECFGSKLDLLNLQWIYRAKKYYKLSPDSLRQLLIPIHYHLRNDQVEQLLQAEKAEDFFSELSHTWYGRHFKETDLLELPNHELLYHSILNYIHHTIEKRRPYSMAVLLSYFYFKEQELQIIITIIESIRYQLHTNTIMTYIDEYQVRGELP